MTAQQLASDYSVRFYATLQETTLIDCTIKFGQSTDPEYNTLIANGRGLINKIQTLAPGANVKLTGRQSIINDILGVPSQPKNTATQPKNTATQPKNTATQPKNTMTFRMEYPNGARPENAPNSGTLDLGNGVNAKWTAKKVS